MYSYSYGYSLNMGYRPFGSITMSPRASFFMGMAAATAFPYVGFGSACMGGCGSYSYQRYSSFGGYRSHSYSYYNSCYPGFSYLSNPFYTNSYSMMNYSNPYYMYAYANNLGNYFLSLAQQSITASQNVNYSYNQLPHYTGTYSNNTVTSSADNTDISSRTRDNTASDRSHSNPISDYDLKHSDLKPGLFKGRLAGQEALVSKLCRKYNVPVGIIAAIIGLESGWGTSNLAYHNNFGGYRKAGDLGASDKGFGYFSSIEKGLEAMIRNIAQYPQRYSDVTAVDWANLDNIARHYCDSTWAGQVRDVYNKNVRSYLA